MIDWVKTHWKKSGTKILGVGTTLVGVLAFIDQATVQLIASFAGPKYAPYVSKTILILAGLAVARRGFVNSRSRDDSLTDHRVSP